jgi:hypothetical protein
VGKNVGKRHFQADFEEKENPQPLAITEVGDLFGGRSGVRTLDTLLAKALFTRCYRMLSDVIF